MMNWKFKNIDRFSILIILHVFVLVLALGFLIHQKGIPPKDREKIVVIPIEGLITMDSNSLGRGQTVASLVDSLNRIAEKDQIKAVVLRINSPGGSVGAVQEIYEAVLKLKSKGKKVVSSFGDVSASGGYYIACASDRIISHPGSITGSIGVILQFPNFQGLLGKVGITFETIKSGSMKDAGSPYRTLSEKERTYFKEVMLDAYDQFYQAVKIGRKLDDKTLSSIADGRIFSGRMAFRSKLVDELGGVDDAIEAAKKLTGLEKKNPEILHHREKPSLDKILSIFSRSPVTELTQSPWTEFRLLYAMQ